MLDFLDYLEEPTLLLDFGFTDLGSFSSCGALHASRKLDLVLPPFSGQAYGAGTVESCALMAAPRLLERRFSTPDTFPGWQNRLGINRGYGDHRRHLTGNPLPSAAG